MAAKAYTTVSGDLWDKIAKEVYGSESYTSFLMGNNQQFIDIFVFPAGIVLTIEDLPETTEEEELPDWRS